MERVEGVSLAEVIQHHLERKPRQLTGADFGAAVRARLQEQGLTVQVAATPTFAGGWVAVCLRVIAAAARAVQHAHERSVVHRDLKPSNIMVTALGHVMLVDFGLASASGSNRITRSGSNVGSAAYMPPESFGDSEPQAAGDIYSLGVSLYELLTLQLPYSASSAEHLLRLIHRGQPRSMRDRNRAVAWDAETVCFTAMNVDPARRYQTAEAFARDLDNVLELRPIEARRPGPWLRLKQATRRNPAAAVAVILAIVLVLVVPVVFAVRETLARQDADHRAYVGNIAAAAFCIRLDDARTAKALLANCSPQLRNWEWRLLAARSDASVGQIATASHHGHASVEDLQFSPDGRLLATASADGACTVRDADTQQILQRWSAPNSGFLRIVSTVRFSPDGQRLLAGILDGTLLEWDIASGALVRTRSLVELAAETADTMNPPRIPEAVLTVA
jgi:hypothetical protein